MSPVATAVFGTNADLIADVASLYLRPGDVVADVTYGTGRFWKKTDVSRYRFLQTDLCTDKANITCDFRQLPLLSSSVDTVVFDPPYIHAPGKGMLKHRYGGLKTTDMATYADIMLLYKTGLAEANRVLKPDGRVWVKCKDTLASEQQRWSHINVYEMALELGMYARDLFILVPPAPPSMTTTRWARQLHARKIHSYLWVFDANGYRRRN